MGDLIVNNKIDINRWKDLMRNTALEFLETYKLLSTGPSLDVDFFENGVPVDDYIRRNSIAISHPLWHQDFTILPKKTSQYN